MKREKQAILPEGFRERNICPGHCEGGGLVSWEEFSRVMYRLGKIHVLGKEKEETKQYKCKDSS